MQFDFSNIVQLFISFINSFHDLYNSIQFKFFNNYFSVWDIALTLTIVSIVIFVLGGDDDS